ncbi:MAG: NAD(P)/FAD-dependent oxidoreductase [Rhodocyclales bacterium]|nr:NAD(P)/FAD-dependent oxidoreductase [Rhodocyclales bacterium]
MTTRRDFLAGGLALAAGRAFGQSPGGARQRVVIVGGGWGGLTAAARLRRVAPELELTLVEREAVFRSLPLSNAWLLGRAPEALPRQDYAAVASAMGYRYLQAEVSAIDRERRRVQAGPQALDYDWLILAAGIRYDYAPWLGDDPRAIEAVRRLYPAGYVAGELDVLRRKLDEFKGGDLLMTVPSGPSRCPPAPYERAVMIAASLKSRKITGRLLLVDAGGGMQRFNRVFAERYKDQIQHLTHATVKAIDPFARILATEFDEIRFDDAIIIPPQGAADIVRQAGLLETDAAGRPGAWAGFDPLHLHAVGDERVFLVGDLLGRASPLFGAYPKSAHMAARQGRIVADAIIARSRGVPPAPTLPDSECHVHTAVDPAETMRIEARYRLRGDGLIVQTVRQHEDPQPRGEDVAWGRALYAEMLGRNPT